MYKIFFALMCCIGNAYSCDFCGGSPSVMNSDLLSIQPQSFIGINTNYRNYKYANPENGLNRTDLLSTNLTIAYAPKKWVELRANLPIIWMSNTYKNVNENTFGIGDMSLIGNFKAINKSADGEKRKVGHIFNVGFGIEFPTGKNKVYANNPLQNFTLGSKSTDFLFSGVYSMSYRKWNLMGSGLVKINTRNKDEVRFGHLYSIQTGTAYIHYFKNSQLLPNAGLRVEIQQKNLYKHIIQKYTGSNALFFQYGADYNFKKWNLGMQIQHPFIQHTAANTIKQGSNFILKCVYMIQKNNQKTKQSCN